ncbi:hypothetical protein [Neobacillus dielmonensis]|uniref:hypothetical protein n=1 Tax=Neobacillus dielmonensis TaxID=1347369 RepID=UPI0005A7C6B4|nr:hypothetical protein [Neobacillus dielmonensis]
MLTEAQQKVKQELEELKLKSLFQENTEVFLPVSVQPKTRWPVYLITFLVLSFIFCYMTVSLSKPSQQNIRSYLSKELDYNRKSNRLLADVLEAHTLEPQQAKSEQLQLLEKTKSLSVPSGFQDHGEDFLSLLEHRSMILANLAESNSIDSNTLNRYLMELEVKQELALDSLMKALDKQGIPYNSNRDGSIQYQIEQKSFEFTLKPKP